MGNHFHLLVMTLEPMLSRGMRQLNGVYAQWFNRRHRRVGHLFQGRYKAVVVQTDAHLRRTVRYVIRNPIRAGLSSRPEQWRGHQPKRVGRSSMLVLRTPRTVCEPSGDRGRV